MAADLQGRVFSTRRLIAWLVNPLATLLVGPLADLVFEPAMSQPSFLSARFGSLVGYGTGSGMALIIVFCGLAMAIVGAGGYGVRVIRDAESILPDYEVKEAPPAEKQVKLQDLLAEKGRFYTYWSEQKFD